MTAGSAALAAGVTVLPDPHFAISDADRQSRETAVMSAYSLQQQLAPARETGQTLSGQIAMMRTNLAASSKLDQVAAQSAQVQSRISRTLTDAYNLENSIDAYQGLPTAAQWRDLDWAWEDAIAAVTALNRLIQQDLPALSSVDIPPAALPVRR